MKKVSAVPFFVLYFSFTIVSNFVHPITPAFLQSINAPSYMSGLAFSTLSFASFLVSPFWGRLGDRVGYAKLMGLGFLGYALGQFMFGNATTTLGVIAARLVSGLLSTALTVNSLAYLVSISDPERNRNKYLAVYATMQSVGAAIGYLVGGVIGDISIPLVFNIQVLSVASVAVIVLLFFKDAAPKAKGARLALRDVNPIASMITSAKQVDAPMMVFLIIVFCSGFAMMAHDNYFNYFLKDQLNFPPSGNGYFKAVVGVIAMVANATINMWITKHTNARKSAVAVLSLCSMSLLLMVSVSGVPMFLVTALGYYTFSVILIPILQVLVMQGGDNVETGVISGLFNALYSLGRTAGPLVAGVVYAYNPLYPFVLAAVMFLLAALLGAYNARQYGAKASGARGA